MFSLSRQFALATVGAVTVTFGNLMPAAAATFGVDFSFAEGSGSGVISFEDIPDGTVSLSELNNLDYLFEFECGFCFPTFSSANSTPTDGELLIAGDSLVFDDIAFQVIAPIDEQGERLIASLTLNEDGTFVNSVIGAAVEGTYSTERLPEPGVSVPEPGGAIGLSLMGLGFLLKNRFAASN
jgi:hypothetical protein